MNETENIEVKIKANDLSNLYSKVKLQEFDLQEKEKRIKALEEKIIELKEKGGKNG